MVAAVLGNAIVHEKLGTVSTHEYMMESSLIFKLIYSLSVTVRSIVPRNALCCAPLISMFYFTY